MPQQLSSSTADLILLEAPSLQETVEAIEQLKPTGNLFVHLPPADDLTQKWRYAIRCIDELGLILRAEIIQVEP